MFIYSKYLLFEFNEIACVIFRELPADETAKEVLKLKQVLQKMLIL